MVSTTDEPPPPNSVVEPMLGPEESTLSRSKAARGGPESSFFDSCGLFLAACLRASFLRSVGETNPDDFADFTSCFTCLMVSIPALPRSVFMVDFAPCNTNIFERMNAPNPPPIPKAKKNRRYPVRPMNATSPWTHSSSDSPFELMEASANSMLVTNT